MHRYFQILYRPISSARHSLGESFKLSNGSISHSSLVGFEGGSSLKPNQVSIGLTKAS